MKINSIILLFGFISSFPLLLKAQYKYEREHRIKSERIPHLAKAFIDSITRDSKIIWYEEINIADVSFEAKFKHDGFKYSVEFDTLGILQDLEFIIYKSEIDAAVYRSIEKQLDELYQKWKIQKIQMHYEGIPEDILSVVRENILNERLVMLYEIVLKGKKQGYAEQYEIIFDKTGAIQTIEQLIQDNVDHLEY
jgi:hypothetical protein